MGLWAEYLQQFTPERVSEITGVDAKLIEDAVVDWATRDDPRIPNGGINYGLGVEHMQATRPKTAAPSWRLARWWALSTPGQRARRTGGLSSRGRARHASIDGGIRVHALARPFRSRWREREDAALYWYGVWCDANAAMECAHKEPDAPYEIHGGTSARATAT